MHLLLWALSVPTNVEKSVRELRLRLFQEWGLVSALALPETLPLLFLPGAAAYPPRHRLPGRLPAPLLSTGGLSALEDCLYWEVQPAATVAQAAELCRRLTPPPEGLKAPFPPHRGFFLAQREGREQLTEILAGLPVPASHTFPALEMVLLRLHSSGGQAGGRWWESVVWQEILGVPLRRGKQAG